MLYPRLLDAVEYVKSKGLKLIVTTNGSLLTGDTINSLIKLKLDKLSISIEHANEKEHAARRSGLEFKEYYQRILDAARIINHSSAHPTILLAMMNTSSKKFFNVDKKIELIETSTGFRTKLTSLICDLCSTIGRNISRESIVRSLAKIKHNQPRSVLIDKQIRVYIQMFMDWGNAFTTNSVAPAKIGYCGYALNNVGVLSNGSVNICCADYDGKTNLGNLKKNSLLSLLLSQKAEAVRKGFDKFRVIHPYCRRCLGSSNKIKAIMKGLLSIYLFKTDSHPFKAKTVEI
ncbi:radical SAM/SPASM domain-containing protein [Acidobacteriota bacterium]